MRPSASKIGALSACQWWARDSVPWVDTSSPAAELGTRVHAAIEADLLGNPEAPAADLKPYVRSYIAWRDRVIGETLRHTEQPLALDLGSGAVQMLPRGEHRSYEGRGPRDLVGTADMVWSDDAGYIVDDVKTGRPENVEAAATNAQMRTLGLMWARYFGVDSIRVRLVFVSPFATYDDEATLDAFDLDAWEGTLREYERTIPSSQPQPGQHCRYCPAAGACPVAVGAIALVRPEPQRTRLPVVARSEEITSVEHARDQYETLRAVKAATDQAWEALRRWVDENGPVALDGGRVYGARSTTRESVVLDTPEAVEVLRSRLGTAWEAAVDLSTSKAAIKAAAKLAAEATGAKPSAVERSTLDALRAIGAVRSKTTHGYEESAAPSLTP